MTLLLHKARMEYLLGAGLDLLHQESREWLEILAFWKDELDFFENLLDRKKISGNNKTEFKSMLEGLEKIQKNIVHDLHRSVVDHEKALVQIEKNVQGLDDNTYRQRHRDLKDQMSRMEGEINEFKKVLFEYAKA